MHYSFSVSGMGPLTGLMAITLVQGTPLAFEANDYYTRPWPFHNHKNYSRERRAVLSPCQWDGGNNGGCCSSVGNGCCTDSTCGQCCYGSSSCSCVFVCCSGACVCGCTTELCVANWNEQNGKCSNSFGEYQSSPATPYSFPKCTGLTTCTIDQYQSTAPTPTTDRKCLGITVCSSSQYQTAVPTLTTDRKCLGLTVCNSTQYQITAPTLITDRECLGLTVCNSTQYQSTAPTPTTDLKCLSLTMCNKFQDTAPTLTSNRKCSVAEPQCPNSQYQTVAATPTSNAVCNYTVDTTTEKISVGPLTGIAISGVIIVAGIAIVFLYKQRETRQKIEDQEIMLLEAQNNVDDARAQVQRMLAAWQIPEDDVIWTSKLASGSYGDVWSGTCGSLPVAIKLLKRAVDEEELDQSAAEDFQCECETLQSIRHPNLLIFYGAGTTSQEKPFMVTELMPLGSLRSVLQDKLTSLSWPVRSNMAMNIATGMYHLHSLQIVHRDLKSDNCLVGDQLNVKVADFGTSKLLRRNPTEPASGARKETALSTGSSVTNASMSMTKGVGTMLWMAPEIFSGNTFYGPEVDVYSYAIIMWELITRENPWNQLEADNFIEFFRELGHALHQNQRPSIPPDFEAEHPGYSSVMRECWATDPESRPSFDAVVFSLKVSEAKHYTTPAALTRNNTNTTLKHTKQHSQKDSWKSATAGSLNSVETKFQDDSGAELSQGAGSDNAKQAIKAKLQGTLTEPLLPDTYE